MGIGTHYIRREDKTMDFKAWLNAKGMGQSEFARKFNIPLRTVQNWAGEQRNPPAYIIEMAEKILEYEKLFEKNR